MYRKFLYLVFFLLLSFNSYPQKLGGGFVQMYSDNYELENPYGFFIKGAYPVTSLLELNIEYLYGINTREYYGFISSGFLKWPLPAQGLVNSKSTISDWEFLLMFKIFNSYYSNFFLGIGLNSTRYHTKRKMLYEDQTASFSDTQFGYTAALNIETGRELLSGIIFFISGKLKGPGASSEMLDAEQPFYSVRVITLELGAGYSF